MVRRLPVIQQSAPEDDAAEARPRWQWVLIGAGLSTTLWLPLVALALPIGARLSSAAYGLDAAATVGELAGRPAAERAGIALLTAGPVLVAFAFACVCAGTLVGRFGPGPRPRTAALGSFSAAAALWSFAAVSGALGPWSLALFSLLSLGSTGAAAGAAGGLLGQRLRRKAG